MRPTWAGWDKGPESLCPRLDLVHKLVVPGLGLCIDRQATDALRLDCLPIACISISGFSCGLPKAVDGFIKNRRQSSMGKTKNQEV